MIGERARLLLVVAACGGSPAQPATLILHAPTCAPVYATYEDRWRAAFVDEMSWSGLAMDADAVDEIVAAEVATLPHRDELAKLRTIYAIIEAFLPDAAWPQAFEAADAAIAVCGEGVQRPR